VTIEELIEFGDRYAAMGTAVQDQMKSVIDGEFMEDQNANAVKIFARFLRRAADYGVKGAEDYALEAESYLEDLS
jgi:hypothetical protein